MPGKRGRKNGCKFDAARVPGCSVRALEEYEKDINKKETVVV